MQTSESDRDDNKTQPLEPGGAGMDTIPGTNKEAAIGTGQKIVGLVIFALTGITAGCFATKCLDADRVVLGVVLFLITYFLLWGTITAEREFSPATPVSFTFAAVTLLIAIWVHRLVWPGLMLIVLAGWAQIEHALSKPQSKGADSERAVPAAGVRPFLAAMVGFIIIAGGVLLLVFVYKMNHGGSPLPANLSDVLGKIALASVAIGIVIVFAGVVKLLR